MENEKKNNIPTFIDINELKDGTLSCHGDLYLCKPEMKATKTGKKYLTVSAGISKRDARLKKYLGPDVPNKDGTTWATVCFWENDAENFEKRMGTREVMHANIAGRIVLKKWTSQDGAEVSRVQININEWKDLDKQSSEPVRKNPADAVFDKEDKPNTTAPAANPNAVLDEEEKGLF